MDPITIRSFKLIFEKEKAKLLFQNGFINEDIAFQKEDLLDESDLQQAEREQAMQIRLRRRESLYLQKIESALQRIHKGSFGECFDCGEEIGVKRLKVRPTATLCISCKEEKEHKEKSFVA